MTIIMTFIIIIIFMLGFRAVGQGQGAKVLVSCIFW